VTTAIFEKNAPISLNVCFTPSTAMIAITGTSHNDSQIADTRKARATVGRACSGNSSPSKLSPAPAVFPPGLYSPTWNALEPPRAPMKPIMPAASTIVVSREFSEELGGRLVVKASQAGAIVIGDEGLEIGIAFGVVEKAAVVGDAVLRHAVEMFAEAAVEALDHAVGLRPEGLGEAVGDGAPGAEPVEGVLARGSVVGFALFVDGEAVGEFGAVVGQDGVDREREAVEEAGQETGGGGGAAIGEDLEIDKAGGTVDRDIGVAAPATQRRQVFDIDVDEAGGSVGVEGGGRRRLRREPGRQAVPLQAAVNALRDSLGLRQRRMASTMSSSGRARLRRNSTIRPSSHSLIVVASRCGRVDRSATS
jgi:hypothetical protein